MHNKKSLPPFEQIKKVHILGVCGTLMGAFAAYLKRRGIEVSGSDQNVYPPMSDVLKEAGVRLLSPYDGKNLEMLGSAPDLVVVGNVISANNPEVQAVMAKNWAYASLPEAMEKLLLPKTTNLVVAGTHGKTTTSSMLAHVLVQCQKSPSYFIGGVSRDLPFSFNVGSLEKGNYFVLEGDEYDTAYWDKVPKFNHYLPDHTFITSVEYDHADIYPDFNAVLKAFEGLVDRIRPGGHLIACYEYEAIRNLVKRAKVPVLSYGDVGTPGARFTPGRIDFQKEWVKFEILDRESGEQTIVDEIMLQVPGKHNVLNALAVWIECQQIGLKKSDVQNALKSFQGVKRRQEVRGEVAGVLVIDDFAHHPTAVRETLRALRLKYPGKRLVAVFEPRSATSRRKIFQKEYAEAFGEADSVFISTPYDQTKIPVENQFSSEELVSDLKGKGKAAATMETVECGVSNVVSQSRSGDVIAVLSNGGFGGFIPKLLDQLKGH